MPLDIALDGMKAKYVKLESYNITHFVSLRIVHCLLRAMLLFSANDYSEAFAPSGFDSPIILVRFSRV